MNLAIIDYVVIGIILIAALVGLKKGFIKVLFDLIRKFASFFIALFLVKPFRTFLRTTIVNDKVYDFFLNWLNGKGSPYTEAIPEGGMSEALADSLNMPKFITDLLMKVIGDGTQTEGMTLGQVLSETLTYYVLTIIAFLVLLILASILIAILSKLLTKAFESEGLKGVNRLLGFVLGIAIGAVTIWIAFIVCDFVGTLLPVVQEKINEWINPESTDFGVARWMYNNNFMSSLVHDYLLASTDVLAREEAETTTECILMWKNLK